MAIPTAYNQISSNRFKTYFIMLCFALFLTGIVYVFTMALGYDGASALSFSGVALIVAGVMNFASYYWSDKIVLKISGCKQIQKKDAPEFFRIVENLAIANGMPMP